MSFTDAIHGSLAWNSQHDIYSNCIVLRRTRIRRYFGLLFSGECAAVSHSLRQMVSQRVVCVFCSRNICSQLILLSRIVAMTSALCFYVTSIKTGGKVMVLIIRFCIFVRRLHAYSMLVARNLRLTPPCSSTVFSLLRLRRKLLRSSTRMRLPILNSVRAWARLFHVSASRGLRPIAAEPQSAQGGTMEQSSRWAKICHFGEVGHWSRSLAAFFFRKFLGD